MRTSIIISGNHEFTNARYKSIGTYFEDADFRVKFHTPDFGLNTIEKLVEEFLENVSPDDKQELTLLGFSMGAMITLVASSKIAVENLILCSPSGYFREYAPLLADDDMAWAKEHLSDFRQWSAKETIKQAKVGHGYIAAGEKELAEWVDFGQWTNDLHEQTGWPLTIVPGTGHEIEAPQYQAAIKTIVQALH